MKTILKSSILILVFLCFNGFSQTTIVGNDNNADKTYKDFSLQVQGIVDEADLKPSGNRQHDTNCDDFNVPNSTTVSGWTEQSGDWQIFNNTLQTPGNSSWEYITFDGSAQADGCITARATYTGTADTRFVGIHGRYASSITNILFKIQDNGGVGYWNSYWIYVDDNLIKYDDTGVNFGTDAIIQMEYSGTSVTVRIDVDRDGTWDYTDAATVTNTTSGLCGVVAYNTAFADDFCWGDTCMSPSVPVPVFNWAIILGVLLIGVFIVVRYRTRLA